MNLTLTREQMERAALVGVRRQLVALAHHRRPIHDHGLWEGHIEGAGSELAVSIAFGLPWTGEPVWEMPPTRQPDVGGNIEVRLARELYLQVGRDDPTWSFVLVQGRMPTYDILGWIGGQEGFASGVQRSYPERTVTVIQAHQLRRFA